MESGAYIIKNGVIEPDLNDEAMAARQPVMQATTITPAADPLPPEVTSVKK